MAECNIPKLRNVPFRGVRFGDARKATAPLVYGSADVPIFVDDILAMSVQTDDNCNNDFDILIFDSDDEK